MYRWFAITYNIFVICCSELYIQESVNLVAGANVTCEFTVELISRVVLPLATYATAASEHASIL